MYEYECGFQTTEGAPDQFVLQRFDKCETSTSDKLEKCVRIVVFDTSKFIPNKEHPRTALIFVFI